MPKPMIPAPEAAARAGLTREALIRRVQTGQVRGELVKGKWLVDANDLERFVGREAQPAA